MLAWLGCENNFEANATRPNLKVLCDVSVSRIFVEHSTDAGIDSTHAGQTYHVKATTEVMLCGGTIHKSSNCPV